MIALPQFRYHPDPLATGAILTSEAKCICCGQCRGYIYTGPVYSREKGLKESICPWCIADCSAAKNFDAQFADDYPLLMANLPAEVVFEVSRCTPGFITWQQEEWIACCNDACVFLGDAKKEDLGLLDDERKKKLGVSDNRELEELILTYVPGGSPAFYKFKCLHCGKIHFNWDCD